jgi:four helix bundle protein
LPGTIIFSEGRPWHVVCARHRVAIYDARDLVAYQRCEELMLAVEAATAQPAARRDFHFCDQINDAALDAASDVSEGFVRYYPADFAHFLNYALASLAEVRRRVEAGYRRGYFPAHTTSDILQLWIKADKAVRGLRRYLWTVKRTYLPPRPQRTRPPLRKRTTQRPGRRGEHSESPSE